MYVLTVKSKILKENAMWSFLVENQRGILKMDCVSICTAEVFMQVVQEN